MADERVGLGERLPGNPVWYVVGAIVLVHIALAALLFDPKPFVGGDNAGYMVLAESLETGRGYRDLYLPNAPRHGQYPPFYPAVLAFVGWLGGGLLAFKVLSVAFTAGSVALLFVLARERLGDLAAVGVATPLALSPALLYYSHWVLSEPLFIILTLLGLWAGARIDLSRRWLIVAAGTALLAYLTRAAGLPLLVALLVALGWRKQWTRLGAVGSSVALVAGGWWAWGKVAAAESAAVYGTNFLYVDPYRPELGYVGPGDLLVRVVDNVRLYAVQVVPDMLAGNDPGSAPAVLAVISALALLALALAGWARRIREVRVLELFTLFYAGLVLLWPQVWTDQRFLLPLAPALLVHAMVGIDGCFSFVDRARPAWFVPAVGALLAVLALPDHARSISVNQGCLRLYRQGDRLACYAPNWRYFVQAGQWVRENTPPDAVVVSRKPRLFYIFSGRRGDVYPFINDETEMFRTFDRLGTDYVVVSRLSQTTFRYLVPVIRGAPERFAPVAQIGDPPVYVLRYRSPFNPPGVDR